MTARALSRLLVMAGGLAALGLLLAAVLAWRLVDLRARVAAAARDCACCHEADRR